MFYVQIHYIKNTMLDIIFQYNFPKIFVKQISQEKTQYTLSSGMYGSAYQRKKNGSCCRYETHRGKIERKKSKSIPQLVTWVGTDRWTVASPVFVARQEAYQRAIVVLDFRAYQPLLTNCTTPRGRWIQLFFKMSRMLYTDCQISKFQLPKKRTTPSSLMEI